MIAKILKFEGLVVFLACLYFYYRLGASWPIFALLWLVPDISMAGYLTDKKIGAIIYNLLHTYILAMAVVVWGLWQGDNFIVSLGVILASHIGLDRFLGFGLKYQSGFKDTHIQKL